MKSIRKTSNIRTVLTKYILFMVPAMLIAAKGYADLWLAAERQPYLALTLLVLSTADALLMLTMASVFRYLSHRHFWIPSGKLLLMVAGMKLFFDYSLGTTLGFAWLPLSVGLWSLWGVLAYWRIRERAQQV